MTTPRILARLIATLAVAIALASTISASFAAENINCAMCHDDVAVTSTAHESLGCQDCHTNVISKRHKAADVAELMGDDICAQCHRMAVRALDKSVHKDGPGCQDCHDKGHVVGMNGHNSTSTSSVSPIHQPRTYGK